jgi:predicted DNA-binding antitoxin AbrB/MazE fold protein
MSIQAVEAVYEHGVFRPVQPLTVPLIEGQRVHLVVDTAERPTDVLSLATSVFEGLSEQEIREIETIARERPPFFGERS